MLRFHETTFRVETVSILSLYLSVTIVLNALPASGDFCRLVATFANSLDPDQALSGSKQFYPERLL